MITKLFSYQFIRFGIAGATTALLELALIILLVEQLQMHYLWANVLSFVFANLFNYVLSRNWVFQASEKKVHMEMLSFFVVTGVGLLINQIIIYVMVDFVHLDYRFAKVLAIGGTVIWNYFGKKKIVFNS